MGVVGDRLKGQGSWVGPVTAVAVDHGRDRAIDSWRDWINTPVVGRHRAPRQRAAQGHQCSNAPNVKNMGYQWRSSLSAVAGRRKNSWLALDQQYNRMISNEHAPRQTRGRRPATSQGSETRHYILGDRGPTAALGAIMHQAITRPGISASRCDPRTAPEEDGLGGTRITR